MLNRKLKRLAVSQKQTEKSRARLTTNQVSIDEVREHNREMADGYAAQALYQVVTDAR